MPRPSGTTQSPARASASADAPVTSWPLSNTRPLVGRINPLITRTVVDLPAPLAPSTASTEPASSRRFTPCNTSICP